MEYIIIQVPDINDSISRVVLSGTSYFIRFSYNDTFDYWKFSLYDSQNVPIVLGVKLVPNFPVNIFLGLSEIPDGMFAVLAKEEHIGRNAFKNRKAEFIFCPVSF